MLSSSHALSRNLLRVTSLSCSSSVLSINKREYHGTAKREILPLILGIGVLAIGRYSWRAVKRMEDEWEEYQWLLQEYETKNGPTNNSISIYPTIAIDLGTIHLKMAHANPKSEIIANKGGGRFTFAGMVQPHLGDDELLLGQRAFENQFLLNGKLLLPYKDPSAIRPVITEAMLDLLAQKNDTKVRSILTIAPIADLPDELFTSLPGATLVPEPVAAIWGAQQQQQPQLLLTGTILVVDIGGFRTTVSMVQKNVVQTSVSLGFGGELYTDMVVGEILNNSPMLKQDPMAMQRVYMAAISAVYQYNSHTQAQIHIPFISMDMITRKPQHLDITISRSIIEQKVQEQIVQGLDPSVLSPALPVPTDLATTWMSVLTHVLTHVNSSPQQVNHVLLVGGGAKQQMMERSLIKGLQALQGNADTLIVPEGRSEVVALGAASMLPNYEYSLEKGLVRILNNDE